jgi:hypothetical protein
MQHLLWVETLGFRLGSALDRAGNCAAVLAVVCELG